MCPVLPDTNSNRVLVLNLHCTPSVCNLLSFWTTNLCCSVQTNRSERHRKRNGGSNLVRYNNQLLSVLKCFMFSIPNSYGCGVLIRWTDSEDDRGLETAIMGSWSQLLFLRRLLHFIGRQFYIQFPRIFVSFRFIIGIMAWSCQQGRPNLRSLLASRRSRGRRRWIGFRSMGNTSDRPNC
jgi:hypothetical protein